MTDPRIPLVRVGAIADLTPDPDNPNGGTERGTYMLDQSIGRLGPGRSGLADKNEWLVAGNKTHLALGQAGFDEIVFVHPNPDQWVVVCRDDMDLSADPSTPEFQKAREMSFVDNQAALVGIKFEAKPTQLAIMQGVELDYCFRPFELDGILNPSDENSPNDPNGDGDGGDRQKGEINCTCPECGHKFIRQVGH